ncbi:MAG: penicillin acylase family protein [Thermodesulfobacteriota bacterium]
MKKVLAVVFGLLVLLIILCGLYLNSFLPDYDQNLSVAGLKARVEIKRNGFAVPSIKAEGLEDLYFAWGYVNAQDRLFQMEITKRIGQGRISEFAGASALSKDVFLRAVGFQEIARKSAAELATENRNLLQRYVDGVNHFIKTNRLPLYFKLLGIQPEPWTLADPLLVGGMLNWSLAYNMKNEILYHLISKKIGPDKTRELLNLIPPDSPAIVGQAGKEMNEERLVSRLRDLSWLTGGLSASNNWVVGPGRSAVKGPILASDPHVHDSKIPSDFCLIRLEAGDFKMAGGQVAGFPFVAFGYNNYLAYGLTNQGADMVDLFFETVDLEKKTYKFRGQDRPLIVKEVEIKVKGKAPVKKKLYYAGRKPLLTEVLPEMGQPISLDWVGFAGMGADGFLELNRARNHSEFTAAANKVQMTPQNMVYADRGGNIAYRTLGALPNRKHGTGNFPGRGDEVARHWEGLVNPKLNPAAINPERGFIATANNRVIKDYPFDMNPTWAPRYRHDRIARMIEDNKKVDAAYMQAMQTDVKSELAGRIQALMKDLVKPGDDHTAREAFQLVKNWDGQVKAEAAAPTIYNTFLMRFMYQTFSDELGPTLTPEFVVNRYISLERFLNLLKSNSDFFDDKTTPAKETPREIATRAFQETVKLLSDYYRSADPRDWHWGRAHLIHFEHLIGQGNPLRHLVHYGPWPLAGDGETNLRAHFYEVSPPYRATLASGIRLIVEFDPEPKGRIMLLTGQNESFFSRHYHDMTDAWLKGEYFDLERMEAKYRTVMTPK